MTNEATPAAPASCNKCGGPIKFHAGVSGFVEGRYELWGPCIRAITARQDAQENQIDEIRRPAPLSPAAPPVTPCEICGGPAHEGSSGGDALACLRAINSYAAGNGRRIDNLIAFLGDYEEGATLSGIFEDQRKNLRTLHQSAEREIQAFRDDLLALAPNTLELEKKIQDLAAQLEGLDAKLDDLDARMAEAVAERVTKARAELFAEIVSWNDQKLAEISAASSARVAELEKKLADAPSSETLTEFFRAHEKRIAALEEAAKRPSGAAFADTLQRLDNAERSIRRQADLLEKTSEAIGKATQENAIAIDQLKTSVKELPSKIGWELELSGNGNGGKKS